MKKVYIIDAVRTPIANFGGAIKSTGAVELGTLLVSHIIKKIRSQLAGLANQRK